MLAVVFVLILEVKTSIDSSAVKEVRCACFRFRSSIVQCAVECWDWLITSRIDLRETLMAKMTSAWQATVDRRMGVFAADENEGDPLAVSEDNIPEPRPPEVEPHYLWIKVRKLFALNLSPSV